MNSELTKNGYFKQSKISDESGKIVSIGEKEVLLSAVLQGRL